MKKRSPKWVREEILLATELYVRANGRLLGPDADEVLRLSNVLNRLNVHHPSQQKGEQFRNPSGIALKLANIRFKDPDRPGGMPNGNRLDGLFWEELEGDEMRLYRLADEIKRSINRH